MSKPDITIIGGGLIGCASAFYLARSGARVALLERGQINQGASGQNAGSLHFQLEHRLIKNIDLNVRELEFYVGLARIAIDDCRNVETDLACDLQICMNGGLMVAETAAEVATLERKAKIEISQGLEVEMLDGAAARQIAPYLSDGILAALYCPHEGHSNPRLLAATFARKAAGLGVTLHTNARVTGLRKAGSGWQVSYRQGVDEGPAEPLNCDVVLNAAGAWAPEIATMAGLHLPLFPVGLLMNATEKVQPTVPHLIQHVGKKLSLKQTDDGNLLIGGGWGALLRQRDGRWTGTDSPTANLDSVRGNLRTAASVVPMVRSLRLLRSWTGTTAITADQLPVLGEMSEAPGFFVAAGGTGYTYGPTYAQLMSQIILTGTSSYSLAPFSPARFSSLNAFMG